MISITIHQNEWSVCLLKKMNCAVGSNRKREKLGKGGDHQNQRSEQDIEAVNKKDLASSVNWDKAGRIALLALHFSATFQT